jgi:hypothetical protein
MAPYDFVADPEEGRYQGAATKKLPVGPKQVSINTYKVDIR